MKFILCLFTFWSFQAMSQESCSTVWLSQLYQTCSHPTHGVDQTRPIDSVGESLEVSNWEKSDVDGAKVCKDMEAQYNRRNLPSGIVGKLTTPQPVWSDELKTINVKRKFGCRIEGTRYAFKYESSKACGLSDFWMTTDGRKSPDPGLGRHSCLTCDSQGKRSSAELAECVVRNVKIVRNAGFIFRPADLSDFKQKVRDVLEIQKVTPIPGLTAEDLLTLIRYH